MPFNRKRHPDSGHPSHGPAAALAGEMAGLREDVRHLRARVEDIAKDHTGSAAAASSRHQVVEKQFRAVLEEVQGLASRLPAVPEAVKDDGAAPKAAARARVAKGEPRPSSPVRGASAAKSAATGDGTAAG